MEAILAEAKMSQDKVCTIPYPVLSPAAKRSPAFPERQKEILFVGRVHPEKGVHLLIEAFRRLPHDRSQTGGW
jgi:glycosyltransferase involved in cell wall biosynthesis